jgi:hypothetical protein
VHPHLSLCPPPTAHTPMHTPCTPTRRTPLPSLTLLTPPSPSPTPQPGLRHGRFWGHRQGRGREGRPGVLGHPARAARARLDVHAVRLRRQRHARHGRISHHARQPRRVRRVDDKHGLLFTQCASLLPCTHHALLVALTRRRPAGGVSSMVGPASPPALPPMPHPPSRHTGPRPQPPLPSLLQSSPSRTWLSETLIHFTPPRAHYYKQP